MNKNIKKIVGLVLTCVKDQKIQQEYLEVLFELNDEINKTLNNNGYYKPSSNDSYNPFYKPTCTINEKKVWDKI